ncbi:MAG: VTT domain-containing protein [gamma proteobacterium symbiont of Bathyaustriella thionipta]|nr:VTT domain-containing protein [gamma proteobacterium symbiont of Bathyaustriella thionipta]
MEFYFHALLEWVAAHPLLAGIAVFLVAMSESLAIVGLIVPGVVFMFGFGALIASGSLSFWPTMAWAVAGAVVGDGLSFMLGRIFKDRISTFYPFNRHPAMLQRGSRFFHRYGGKSVIFGRFVGPVRAVIPLVAGMLKMPARRFFAANVFSALIWAPAYLIPGMVFGASLELAAEVALRLVVMLLLISVLLFILVWSVRTFMRLLLPVARLWVRHLMHWASEHRFTRDIAAALDDPHHPEARWLALFAALLVLAVLLTGIVSGILLGDMSGHGLDHAAFEGLQALRTPFFTQMMIAASRLADAPLLLALFAGIAAWLIVLRNWQALGHWLAAGLFALLAGSLLKWGLQLPRPPMNLPDLDSPGFPSNHALRATVLYGFLAVMVGNTLRGKHHWLVYFLAAFLVFAVGFSRLYLGAHWFSDVIGGIFIGLIWVTTLALAYKTHVEEAPDWRGMALVSISTLLLVVSIFSYLNQARDTQRYTPFKLINHISQSDWHTLAWKSLPAYRIDLFSDRSQRFNFQYAGDLAHLKKTLLQQGWQLPDKSGWQPWIRLFAPSESIAELPVLAHIHDGEYPDLTLIKPIDSNSRYILNVWSTHYRVGKKQAMLWIGYADRQEKTAIPWILSYAKTSFSSQEAFEQLATDSKPLLFKQVESPQSAPVLLIQENPQLEPSQAGHQKPSAQTAE